MPQIDRILFVYDADGTLVGEAKYWFGTLFGGAHCSLCDITHHRFGKRSSFKECAERIDTPIEYLHRDDLTPAQRGVAPQLPAVLGESTEGVVLLLGPAHLGALQGDVSAFEAALTAALSAAADAPAAP
ncbi:MAG: hypothetical protein ABMA25_00920 [Ilumatobacteraceae bacterium]